MSARSILEVQPNMEVFTADAVHIGRVKSVEDNEILVDRDRARDIFIPLTFINLVIESEQRIDLSITETDYQERDWESPPIL